jgi:hypothetical protein
VGLTSEADSPQARRSSTFSGFDGSEDRGLPIFWHMFEFESGKHEVIFAVGEFGTQPLCDEEKWQFKA